MNTVNKILDWFVELVKRRYMNNRDEIMIK